MSMVVYELLIDSDKTTRYLLAGNTKIKNIKKTLNYEHRRFQVQGI